VYAEFNLKQHNNIWDSTFRLRSREYCDAVGFPFTGRLRCPVRPEGHPQREACEVRVIGVQQWWCDGEKIDSTANPAQARCKGFVKTCTEDSETCAVSNW
jgi:hypothetical protein